MGILKRLLEAANEFATVIVHDDMHNATGLSKKSDLKMSFSQIQQKLGDPIILGPDEDGRVNWVLTLVPHEDELGSEFNVTIYSNPRYYDHVQPHEMNQWCIGAKSPWEAWQIEAILQDSTNNIEVVHK